MTAARIAMTVQRDGYWEGQYPRVGDTILVDPEHVETLVTAQFAIVTPPVRVAKGSKHAPSR